MSKQLFKIKSINMIGAAVKRDMQMANNNLAKMANNFTFIFHVQIKTV